MVRKSLRRISAALVLLLVGSLLLGSVASANEEVVKKAEATNGITLVSKSKEGVPANEHAYRPSFSADHRYVAFITRASNLFDGQVNIYYGSQVFVKDILTGGVELISQSKTGQAGNREVWEAVISKSARYVVYSTDSSNILENDSGLGVRILFKDRFTGETTLVSRAYTGEVSVGWDPTFSPDEKFIIFVSDSDQLVPDDTNNKRDVFVFNISTGEIKLVSRSPQAIGNGDSEPQPGLLTMTADDRLIVFSSDADNLVVGDNNHKRDVFVHDLTTNENTLVSKSTAGELGNGYSQNGYISEDGKLVVFESDATNLDLNNPSPYINVFVREIATGQTRRIYNVQGSYPKIEITANNQYVVFDNTSNVYRFDLATGESRVVNQPLKEPIGTSSATFASGSPDGRYVLFASGQKYLVPEDLGDQVISQVYIRDMSVELQFTISGTVLGWGIDAQKRPVYKHLEGVTVTAHGEQDYSAITDENGFYTIQVPTGNYLLTAELAGFQAYYTVDADNDGVPENARERQVSLTSDRVSQDFLAIPCISKATKLNICDLKKGDILLKDKDDKFGFELEIASSYFMHAAMVSNPGNLVEAAGAICKDGTCHRNQDVRNQAIQDNDFYQDPEITDWVVLRVKPQYQNKIDAAVAYALTKAQDPNVTYVDNKVEFLDMGNKYQEKKFYCSLLIWRSYKEQGLDLDYNLGLFNLPNQLSGQVLPDDLFSSHYDVLIFGAATDIVASKPGISGEDRYRYTMLSPANILVTDDSGHRSGYDSEVGDVVNTIPGSYYSGPGTEPQWIRAAITGSSSIEVYGTGAGSYTLSVAVMSQVNMTTTVHTGVTFPGKIEVFSVKKDTSGTAIQIIPIATPTPTSQPDITSTPTPTGAATPQPTPTTGVKTQVFLPLVER